MENKIIIHTDGGARGNPGPAAIGVIIEGPAIGRKEYGEYLGTATNNQAEYQAVIFALKKVKHLLGSDKAKESLVEIFIDSELLTRQINGEYKIKENEIQKLFLEIWNARLDFGEVRFNYISRGENKAADKIVNQVLDKEASKLNI